MSNVSLDNILNNMTKSFEKFGLEKKKITPPKQEEMEEEHDSSDDEVVIIYDDNTKSTIKEYFPEFLVCDPQTISSELSKIISSKKEIINRRRRLLKK